MVDKAIQESPVQRSVSTQCGQDVVLRSSLGMWAQAAVVAEEAAGAVLAKGEGDLKPESAEQVIDSGAAEFKKGGERRKLEDLKPESAEQVLDPGAAEFEGGGKEKRLEDPKPEFVEQVLDSGAVVEKDESEAKQRMLTENDESDDCDTAAAGPAEAKEEGEAFGDEATEHTGKELGVDFLVELERWCTERPEAHDLWVRAGGLEREYVARAQALPGDVQWTFVAACLRAQIEVPAGPERRC